jgi:uncharacterized protein HemX
MSTGSDKLNVNTILLTVVLGLSGWSLLEQNAQGKAQAAYAVRQSAQEFALEDLRARMQKNDAAITELQLQIARLR